MKPKPIIFNGEMVRAILEGRKTQTRRVIKPQPPDWVDFLHHGYQHPHMKILCTPKKHTNDIERPLKTGDAIKSPYQIGHTIWVRETWRRGPDSMADGIEYKADNTLVWYHTNNATATAAYSKLKASDLPKDGAWRSPVHMPHWASRIQLLVKDVRVERLQDISEEDAIKEGIKKNNFGAYDVYLEEEGLYSDATQDASEAFMYLWNSIYEKRGYGWNVNPWIWVTEFERVEAAKCHK